jgi:hypothetical protein
MRAKKAIRAAKTGRGTRKASVPKKAGRGASADTKGVAEYIAGIPESSRKTFDALRAAGAAGGRRRMQRKSSAMG